MRWQALLFSSLLFLASQNLVSQEQASVLLAATPPMGWNSWDGYGTTVNEDQFKANAAWFAKNLKPLGWQYIVVDMEWFVTNPTPEGNSKDSPVQPIAQPLDLVE
jgi:alpha-galactosidase